MVGPMPTKPVGGREYAYTDMDDYTRVVYTRPLRHKSEAANAFKSFRAAAENKFVPRLRAVVINNACELSMGEVRDICEQDGIKLDILHRMGWLSAPSEYSPTRCTLCYTTQVSRILWAEAFNTATYVQNRTPTRTLDGRTPLEIRCGAKPDLAHLRAPHLGRPSAAAGEIEEA